MRRQVNQLRAALADLGSDLRALVDVLDRHGVDYLFVGGIAAIANGATRLTHDLDLMPKGGDNLTRLAAALDELNARLRLRPGDEPLPVPDVEVLVRQLAGSTWITDAGPVDVLVAMRSTGGRDVFYEDVVARAITSEAAGVEVIAVGLDDLIAAKEAAGRPKDRDALRELHSIREQQPDA